jgi:hypothetical protein
MSPTPDTPTVPVSLPAALDERGAVVEHEQKHAG